MNVLLVTLDQFRGDCLSAAGHPVVRTPALDRLAASGVRACARHYSQAAPCGPGRACLYTGTYQFNNRVVGNGTPLDDRFDNVARVARRAGYVPTIFGYADQGLDPRLGGGPGDDRNLSNYQGFPPGFEVRARPARRAGCLDSVAGRARLRAVPRRRPSAGDGAGSACGTRGVGVHDRHVVIEWLERQDGPWFAHASYWRPHPPYAAAGGWSKAYDPADVRAAGRPTRPRSAVLRPSDGPGSCRRAGRCASCGPSTTGWSPTSTTS